MTAVSRSTLKAYFNTGDTPTEAQFANLIDSCPNFVDDGIPVLGGIAEYLGSATAGTTAETFGSTFTLPANTFTVNGSSLIVSAWGILGTVGNVMDLGVRFDGNDKLQEVERSTGYGAGVRMIADIVRIDASNAHIHVMVFSGINGSVGGDAQVSVGFSSVAVDWSTALDLNLRGQSPDMAGDLTMSDWKVSIQLAA